MPSESQIRCPYRQWGNKNMEGALLAVEEGVSVRRAAEMYGVPKSTLHDRIAGKVDFYATSRPKLYLTVAEGGACQCFPTDGVRESKCSSRYHCQQGN